MKVTGEVQLGIKIQTEEIRERGFYPFWPFKQKRSVMVMFTQHGKPMQGDGKTELFEGDSVDLG